MRSLIVGGQTYRLEVADTEVTYQKGLGDRLSLPQNRGMVFVYPNPQPLCFWMKDMRFSLDIIWLNGDKQIIKIAPGVAPSTYPKTYCSDSTAEYVVELNAGQAQLLHLRLGQTLHF
jgi:uncharacterized membrane protein (UPF0127 family)